MTSLVAVKLRAEDAQRESKVIFEHAVKSAGPKPPQGDASRDAWTARFEEAQKDAIREWYDKHPLKDGYIAAAYWKIKEAADLIATLDSAM